MYGFGTGQDVPGTDTEGLGPVGLRCPWSTTTTLSGRGKSRDGAAHRLGPTMNASTSYYDSYQPNFSRKYRRPE